MELRARGSTVDIKLHGTEKIELARDSAALDCRAVCKVYPAVGSLPVALACNNVFRGKTAAEVNSKVDESQEGLSEDTWLVHELVGLVIEEARR